MNVLQEIRQEIKNNNFLMQMETHDMSEFFPADEVKTITAFMNNDNQFTMRRRGLCELLRTAVSNDKKKFHESLLKTLFTLKFKAEVKWPTR